MGRDKLLDFFRGYAHLRNQSPRNRGGRQNREEINIEFYVLEKDEISFHRELREKIIGLSAGLAAEETQELKPRALVGLKGPQHGARRGIGVLFFHASHRHA